MVSDQAMTAVELATLLEVPTEDVESTLLELAKDYVAAGRGFELRIVDGGWRFSLLSSAQMLSLDLQLTDGRRSSRKQLLKPWLLLHTSSR